jgi:SNF2 family DNA or RNA helicase
MTTLIYSKEKCFVFGGVGVGKSKSAIDAVALLWAKGDVQKALIVSPASIMWNFGNEIETHSDLDYTIIHGSLKKRRELIKDSNAVFDIINYEILAKMADEIKENNYDIVIFDEVHYCKTRNSNRSKAAYKIAKSIPRRVGLSGTIISNNYEDLYMPYKIIDETIFGTRFLAFKNRYFIIVNWYGYDEIEGYKNEEEIKKLVATNSIKFSIRDVVKNLPPEKNIVKKIPLSTQSKKLYKELEKHMMVELEEGVVVAANVLERMIRLSQITSGFLVDKESQTIHDISNEKLSLLQELLEQIDQKTVIFCRFRRSIDLVAGLCDKLGISYYIYDGRTKEKDLYLKFNKDDTRVWIAQLQKSEGYSLPTAQYCIFYELDYSRKNHIQSRGRILRATGSPHNCIFYIYILAEKTIDEIVYKALQEKDFTSKQALEFVRGSLKKED